MNREQNERLKCLIIGSGASGYTAAIYAARADLKPVLYTGLLIGGQLTKTTDVENYPGYPDGVMGPEMMESFHKQASRMGADLRMMKTAVVEKMDSPDDVAKATINGLIQKEINVIIGGIEREDQVKLNFLEPRIFDQIAANNFEALRERTKNHRSM